ncbi:MAG: Gfo/Idh/MocA family oxidoreductase [Armatimonadetes bacterium]|nr:Gfo/Idh/MocA family oxidoreductase [Armatimonadota bacterium]
MQTKLTFVLLGAGARGTMFAEILANDYAPGTLVAVAEPNPERRAKIAEMHGIPAERQYETWEALLAESKLADVAINTTMDRHHVESSLLALGLGYHMLLEKPMASTLADCVAIADAARKSGRIVSICHSLRYNDVYSAVRDILASGRIGDIVSVDQLEAVEHIHQSHSFVRGNWGNESRSAFMLLAKSCHDIDILFDLVHDDCVRVGSFGSLKFFTKAYAPEGAPLRCLDGCPAEDECPYHAMKVYGAEKGWGRYIGLPRDPELLRPILMEGPYGKCVFQTDNDVVDHQVVTMEFAKGQTVTFTMTAFTHFGGRRLRIHGTKGYLEAATETRKISVQEFWGEKASEEIEIPVREGGHGGADPLVIGTLIRAIESGDPSLVTTNTENSLKSHKIVFAAERARREGRVVNLSELD